MKKVSLAIALAALLGASAFAQTSGPGQDKSSASKPATAAEKAAAKSARKTIGAAAAKEDTHADADPAAAGGARLPKAERKAASVKRKAAGAKAIKEPKDATGPNS